jgi:LysM repeat protein
MTIRPGVRVLLIAILVMVVLGVQAVLGQPGNLLSNPGLEPPFVDAGGDPRRLVAQGWQPWHVARTGSMSFSENLQPEYYAASDTTNGLGVPRIRSGSDAQQFSSFFGTFTGGLYQRVTGVSAGTTYTFSVFAYVWSSALDNAALSDQPGGVRVQVGIDPTGGTNGESAAVVWSPLGSEVYDAYNAYLVSAAAQGGALTVFVRAQVQNPVKSNVVYVDDAALTGPGVPPTSAPVTATSVPASATIPSTPPTATATPTTPPPTNIPTLTNTPILTNTPPPTLTETPTSTFTVSPSPTIDNTQFPGRYVYTVQAGDTVAVIAAAFGSSVDAIIGANGLNANGLIFVGQQLVVPVRLPFVPPTATPATGAVVTLPPLATTAPTSQPTTVPTVPPTVVPTSAPVQPTSAPPAELTTTYVVRPGDTLSGIAARFGTTVGALSRLNNISNANMIYFGQRLIVPGAPAQATAVSIPTSGPIAPPRTYVVQRGDNLYFISLRFNVPLSAIVRANGISNPNRLYAGQTLIIP